MPKFELIIFDFDGVLVDSEYIAAQVTAKLLNQYGIKTNLETTLKRFVGQHADAIIKYLENGIGIENIEDFREKSKVGNEKAFQEKLVALPHVVDTLSKLNYKFCIGSNSGYDSLIAKLEITKLARFFSQDELFVSAMVANPKPAPDVFLYAAKMHNIAPEKCLVIEDTTHGIHAAISANMSVIGYFGATHCYENYEQTLIDAGALYTFKDMRELPNIINKLNS